MKKLALIAATAMVVSSAASAQNKGPSGVFTSEGFGFNEGTGSFAGCTSGGQGFGGDTGCNSNASLRFNTTNRVSAWGDVNAGNLTTREREGSYQSGAFGVWQGRNDVLAIGSGRQGAEHSQSVQGYSFEGKGDFHSTTNIRGGNSVNTYSRFWSK